jgi:hypothetical protein
MPRTNLQSRVSKPLFLQAGELILMQIIMESVIIMSNPEHFPGMAGE